MSGTTSPPAFATQDRGPVIIDVGITLCVLVVVALILRFWSRTLPMDPHSSHTIGLWWDDWLALGAAVFAVPIFATMVCWVRVGGLGRHISTTPPHQLTYGFKMLLVLEFLYNTSTALSRLSALTFYLRIFKGYDNKRMKYAFYTAIVCCNLFFIVFAFFGIFQCIPIKKIWIPESSGHCLRASIVLLYFTFFTFFIDLIILLIPMPLLWNLRVKPLKRFRVICLFAIGYCNIFAVIGRTASILVLGRKFDHDVTYEGVPVIYWLILEPVIAIISICSPAIFLLFHRCIRYGPTSLFGSKFGLRLPYSGTRSIPRFGGTKRRKSTTTTNLESL